MKNLLKNLLIFTALIFSACSPKIPFSPEKPKPNASLLYIYVPTQISNNEEMNDDIYKIRINKKSIEGSIKDGEYMRLLLKPNETKISIVKGGIFEKELTLSLDASKIYYLKVNTNLDNGSFEFLDVKESEALDEIKKTGLAGSKLVREDEKLTEIVEETTTKPQTISKIDEIEKAYKLKEKGILTDAEFKKLKAEILAK